MCAIAGIINIRGSAIDQSLLHGMNETLRHRGPNDEGYVLIHQQKGKWAEFLGDASDKNLRDRYPLLDRIQRSQHNNIGLAHRRFSIIDLTIGGHQPFFDTQKYCCVVANGEIFNYLELREQLINLGHVFRTASDTEVILEAYKAWDVDCFLRFNGMWALALYDFRRKRLILSRDRLGEIPLYWTKCTDSIYFASEIKALLKIPSVGQVTSVNETAVYHYLEYGLRDLHNTTFFEGINSFPAASWSVLSNDFPSTIESYWHVPKDRLREKDISVSEGADRLRDTLRDSVGMRMRADVSWGVELSGGLDSSSIVAFASQLSEVPIKTYTVRYPEQELNETSYAYSVSKYYGTDHHVVEPSVQNLWHEIRAFTALEEEPTHAPNIYTRQLIGRMMRADGLKMVLVGEGGDELFAGYDRHFMVAQVENLFTRQFSLFLTNGLNCSHTTDRIASLLKPALSFVSWALDRCCLIRQLRQYLQPRKKQGGNAHHVELTATYSKKKFSYRTLSQALLSELTNTSIPYWLRTNDRTRMGIPLEGRSPFLDHRVVELAFSLPVTYLIRDGWHKWILRKALRGMLPHDVVWRRKKSGLQFPFQSFYGKGSEIIEMIFRQPPNPYIDLSSFLNFGDYCDRKNLQRWGQGTRIWRIISFLLWHEWFVNKDQGLFTKIEREQIVNNSYTNCGIVPEFLTSPGTAQDTNI